MKNFLPVDKMSLLTKCISMPRTTAPRILATVRLKTTDATSEEEPVKFTSTSAFKGAGSAEFHRAKLDARPRRRPRPKYEASIIAVSFAAFLIYFCVLREENDIDKMLEERTIFDHIEGLERQTLEVALINAEKAGADTTQIKQRLQVLKADEEAKASH